MFPYKVDVPMARWPIANLVLMAITIIVSLAMFGPLDDWDTAQSLRNPSPEVIQILGQAGIKPSDVQDAAYPAIVDQFLLQPGNFHFLQLFGHVLIHAGFGHLLGNLFFLFLFGNAVNAKLGHGKFLLVYFGVGAVEGLVWLIAGPHAPVLGASGAIMGIVGAFLVLYPLNDVSIVYWFTIFYRGTFQLSAMWVIAFYVAMDVYQLITARDPGVAYLSHVVGFATGALTTAAILKYKVVEMDRGEKSLLQVWGWMPHTEEAGMRVDSFGRELPQRPAGAVRARPMASSLAEVYPTRGGTSGRSTPSVPPRRSPPKDDGPIDLIWVHDTLGGFDLI